MTRSSPESSHAPGSGPRRGSAGLAAGALLITAAGLFGPAASLLAVVGAPASSVILSTATATACVVAIFKFSTVQGDPEYYV